jgi:chromosome partitioning protein
VVRDNVRLAEAPSFGEPITTYAPKSAGAEDYRAVARELLLRYEKLEENSGEKSHEKPPRPRR